jgi:hypothetical protein
MTLIIILQPAPVAVVGVANGWRYECPWTVAEIVKDVMDERGKVLITTVTTYFVSYLIFQKI